MSRARIIAFLFIGFVVIVGGVFLLISLIQGDDTGDIDPNPTPPPSNTSN